MELALTLPSSAYHKSKIGKVGGWQLKGLEEEARGRRRLRLRVKRKDAWLHGKRSINSGWPKTVTVKLWWQIARDPLPSALVTLIIPTVCLQPWQLTFVGERMLCGCVWG
jgi:hypothetical protein